MIDFQLDDFNAIGCVYYVAGLLPSKPIQQRQCLNGMYVLGNSAVL